ncbi:hypothetical protein P19_0067 [Aeromonas phage P19]|nr:hypothetical protein P19_0067 [Aeromonas phage P19]
MLIVTEKTTADEVRKEIKYTNHDFDVESSHVLRSIINELVVCGGGITLNMDDYVNIIHNHEVNFNPYLCNHTVSYVYSKIVEISNNRLRSLGYTVIENFEGNYTISSYEN